MYEMKEEYLIGIEEIDREHKVLFEIADEIYQLCGNEFVPDKYDHIRHILEELRDYTLTHFEHEEAYMESVGYKRLPEQKRQHEAFEETIGGWDMEAIDEDQDETIEEILRIVTNWLVNHILYEDKLIGE